MTTDTPMMAPHMLSTQMLIAKMLIAKMLIDGQLVSGGVTAPIINPATGVTVADVPQASLAQLDEAVTAARRAAPGWAADRQERGAVLAAMAGIVAENRDALARLISLENGLPFKVTQDEVGAAAMFLKYRARTAEHVDSIHDDEKQRVEVIRRPVGVVGAIIPWNAPMMIACEKIGTAFAAGDTVVLKSSPLAPLALLLLGELVRDAVHPGRGRRSG